MRAIRGCASAAAAVKQSTNAARTLGTLPPTFVIECPGIMAEPKPSFNPRPSKPRLALPRGACDSHFHVFGPVRKFPFAADRTYTPADAPKETLFALHKHLGVARGVVVQSVAHGMDNSASADLIAADPTNYVGVALVPVSVSLDDIQRLNRQGFRGARFHYMGHLGEGFPIDDVIAFASKLADIGWHLQLHTEGGRIGELAPALQRSPVPVVIDHIGRIDASQGLNQKPFQELLQLMNNRNIWVKVSGCERISRQSSPWKDALPFARKLVEEFPAQTVWGSDWPHPNLKEIPDDGVMVDNLAEIAPSEKQRQALLVDNPARFYGFKA
jgi:2-pyrone-4,6-dicarboxylate lactonase